MKQLPLKNTHYRQLQAGFTQWLALLGYAPTSCYNQPHQLREFLHWLEGQTIYSLEALQAQDLAQYLTYLRNRVAQRGKQSLSPSYLNKHLQALKNFAKYLDETQQGSLPMQIKYLPSKTAKPFILSLRQIEELYAATQENALGLRDRAMLGIYYGCGLRRSEGLALELTDILLPQAFVHVRRGKNYQQRYVPLCRGAAQDLHNYLADGRPKLHPLPRETAFFLSAQGQRPQAQSLVIRLKRLAQQAQIQEKISLHSLRHAIATHLLEAGMKLMEISHFLGHKSLESTQIYTHIKVNDE